MEISAGNPSPADTGFRARCSCGQLGHVNTLATPTRIVEAFGGGTLEQISAIRARDPEFSRAQEVFGLAGTALGRALAHVSNTVNPSWIVMYLPPALADAENKPDTAGAAYLAAVRTETLRAFAASDEPDYLRIRPFPPNPQDVALLVAQAACVLANRRLNRLPVPNAARVLEVVFVAVLTVLRYASLHIQGADVLTAVGAAMLAALISALGLLGIEEIVVETRTLAIFFSTLQVSWRRRRCAAALARLARIQAGIKATAGKLQQHFLDFLLKVEELPVDEARRRAAALRAALTDADDNHDTP